MSADNRWRAYLQPMIPLPTDVTPRIEVENRWRCIIFDIYGTLFISGCGDIQSKGTPGTFRTCLEPLLKRYQVNQTVTHIQQALTEAIETHHQQLQENGIDYPEIRIDEIWMEVLGIRDRQHARDFAIEYELIVNPVYPMPHLKETLDKCRSAQLFMGIISNAQFFTPRLFNWFLNATLEGLGFDPELTILSFEHQRAKPSLVLFETIRHRLEKKNIPSDMVLYVGNDMRNDIYPAQKTGFKTALFAGDRRSLRLRADDPCCQSVTPDIVITDLNQLNEMIDNQFVIPNQGANHD